MTEQKTQLSVCILTSQYFGWGKIGGFGSMSRALAEALAARGVKTSVIVPRRPGQQPRERLGGVDVLSFPPLDIRAAAYLLRETPADVFHSQDPQFLTALAQWVRPEAKHVVTCRDPRDTLDWLIEFRDATWGRRLRIPLNWFLETGPLVKWAVRRADAVFTPANFLREKARRIFRPKAEVGFMPNLIAVPEPAPEKPETPMLTFIGRLDRRKRPELFLDLAKACPQWNFAVVGKAESDRRFSAPTGDRGSERARCRQDACATVSRETLRNTHSAGTQDSAVHSLQRLQPPRRGNRGGGGRWRGLDTY